MRAPRQAPPELLSSSSWNPLTDQERFLITVCAVHVLLWCRLMRFLRVIRLIKSLLQNCIYAALSVESKYLQFLKGQNFMYLCYIVYVILVMVNFIGCLW